MSKNKYKISDFFFKVLYKISDYILRIKWRILLGKLGNASFLRGGVKVIGNSKRIYIGSNFKVYQNVIFAIGKGEIEIGNNGLIGVGCYLNCGSEKLIIGNNVAIAPYVKFFTYSHHFESDKSVTEAYRNGNIIVEDDVLIGSNTVILPGIKIGKGAVIAAGSVVNKDVENYTIVGGVPIKYISTRRSE